MVAWYRQSERPSSAVELMLFLAQGDTLDLRLCPTVGSRALVAAARHERFCKRRRYGEPGMLRHVPDARRSVVG
jgi:hypothetical protein